MQIKLHFETKEMLQVLKNNGYAIKKEKRKDYTTDYVNKYEFETDVYIVYLDGKESFDSSYPCKYRDYDIVKIIFAKIYKEKILGLLHFPIVKKQVPGQT